MIDSWEEVDPVAGQLLKETIDFAFEFGHEGRFCEFLSPPQRFPHILVIHHKSLTPHISNVDYFDHNARFETGEHQQIPVDLTDLHQIQRNVLYSHDVPEEGMGVAFEWIRCSSAYLYYIFPAHIVYAFLNIHPQLQHKYPRRSHNCPRFIKEGPLSFGCTTDGTTICCFWFHKDKVSIIEIYTISPPKGRTDLSTS